MEELKKSTRQQLWKIVKEKIPEHGLQYKNAKKNTLLDMLE